MQLKSALKILSRNIGLRIGQGPNKGRKWSLATGSRYLNGTFEEERVNTILTLLQPASCFWDMGASFGYVTLAVANYLGDSGRVVAFEPARPNLWYLKRHVGWNHCRNVTIVPAAISNFDGTAAFALRSTLSSQLNPAGEEQVDVRALSTLLSSSEYPPPNVLKMDIEGAEADALENAVEFLKSNRNLILIVSAHSAELYERCLRCLKSCGYIVLVSDQISRMSAEGWQGDVDVIAFASESGDFADGLPGFSAIV